MIVFAKQHRGSDQPCRRRSAAGRFIAMALLISLSGACGDPRTPVAPDDSGAPVVSPRASMDRTSAGADVDDITDAIDRISPVLGDGPAANQVRGALKDLLDDALKNNVQATQRDAAALSQALDRLASLGDAGLAAEIDAIRLVADARS